MEYAILVDENQEGCSKGGTSLLEYLSKEGQLNDSAIISTCCPSSPNRHLQQRRLQSAYLVNTTSSVSSDSPKPTRNRPRCASMQARGGLYDDLKSGDTSPYRPHDRHHPSSISAIDPFSADLPLHDGFVAADLERLLVDGDTSFDLEVMSREWQRFSRFLLSFPASSQTPVQYELFGWFLEMSQYFPNMDDICTEFTNMLQQYRCSKRTQSKTRLRGSTASPAYISHLNSRDTQSPRSIEWHPAASTDTDSPPWRCRMDDWSPIEDTHYHPQYNGDEFIEPSMMKMAYRKNRETNCGLWGEPLEDESLTTKSGEQGGTLIRNSQRRRPRRGLWRRDRVGYWSENERRGEMEWTEENGSRLFLRYSSRSRRQRVGRGENSYSASLDLWSPIALSRQTCSTRRKRRSIVGFSTNGFAETLLAEKGSRAEDETRMIHRVKSSPRLYDVYEDAVSTASPTTLACLQKAEMNRVCDHHVPRPISHTLHYPV